MLGLRGPGARQFGQQRVKDVQEAGHDLEAEGMQAASDDLSVEWEARQGGADTGWKAAKEDPPDANWFELFSMASDNKFSKTGFLDHKSDNKVAGRVDRLANSMA